MIEYYQTVNPATGCVIEYYPTLSQFQLDSILTGLEAGQKNWHKTSIDERVSCIRNIRQHLLANIDDYAQLITDEMGKTLAESNAEIKKCVFLCDYYAEHAPEYLVPKKINYKADVTQYKT